MAKSYSVTSEGVNPSEDRVHRMRMYFIAMSLRVVCVASLFWAKGWWILLAAAGAVILPWFAVMVGNAVAHGGGEAPDQPEPLQILPAAAPETAGTASDEETLIVIDVEPERRAAPESSSAPDTADPTSAPPEPPGHETQEGGAV